jgi:hypothetical protein
MKKLKQLSLATALTFMLATGAFAGTIDTPAVQPPPPPPPDSSSSVATPGDMETPGVTQGPGLASDSVTEVALSLLQSVLSVF